MNPALQQEIETILQLAPVPAKLKAAAPLEVASRMLSSAPGHDMMATTVVGVLGRDDVDAFRSLVAKISAEYGLEATVKLREGSYSVRFSRPLGPTIH